MAFRHYAETINSWQPSVANAWVTDFDLIQFGIPPSAVVEIALDNASNVAELSAGVRATSGTLDRRITIVKSLDSPGESYATMYVQADALGKIDYYAGNLAQISFQIVGYWVGCEYQELFTTFDPSGSALWTGHSLSQHGISTGEIVDITLANQSLTLATQMSVRSSGSLRSKLFDITPAEGAGNSCVSTLVKTSGTNAAIEIYSEDIANSVFYLLGHFTQNPGDFTEKTIEFTEPSLATTWLSFDVGASGIPSNSSAIFTMSHTNTAADVFIGLRASGSTTDRILNLNRVGAAGGTTSVSVTANVGVNGNLEQYANNITGDNPRYTCLGYWDNFVDSLTPFSAVQTVNCFIEGLNPFIHYVETDATIFNATPTGVWSSTQIPTSLQIPTATEASPITVEIVITNFGATLSNTGGARSVGSVLDRKFDLNPAFGGGLDTLTMMVPVDANGNIELYTTHLSFLDFQILGYWRGAQYIEDATAFQVNAENSWINFDLGAAYADKVVEIIISNNSITIPQSGGVRSVGSAISRHRSLSFGSVGKDYLSMHVNASGANGTIQVYASNSGNIQFTIAGGWETPPGQYTELMAAATTATSTSFILRDIGIAENSVAELVVENRDFNSDWTFGIRESGSTFARSWKLRQTNATGDGLAASMLRSSVNMRNGSSIETSLNFTGANHQYTKVGFWDQLNRVPIASSGSAFMFMSGVPASIKTSGAEGGLYPSGVSMFMHGAQIGPPFDLFIRGIDSASGAPNLFIFGVNIFRTDSEFSIQYPSGVTLAIQGGGVQSSSGQVSGVLHGHDLINISGTSFIAGVDSSSTFSNLFLKVSEPQTAQITLYLQNTIDPGPGLIREPNAVFYLSRRDLIDSPVTRERLQDIDWSVSQTLFDNKPLLAQVGATNTAGDNAIPIYNDMGGSFSSSAFGFALIGNVPDQQNLMGHIISPADYIYAGSGSITAAFWMSGANTSGNIVDIGWFNRLGLFSALGNSQNDHTVGIRITSGNKVQVRTSVRDLPYDRPTATGLWWGGTTHYGTPTGSSWTWRTSNEYWAWNEEWPAVDIVRGDISFFMVRSDFVANGVISGLPAHMNVSLSVNGDPWVAIGSGATGPPASSLFSASEPTNAHAENAVGVMVQAVNADGGSESLLVNELVLWTDSNKLSNGELTAFHSLAPTFFRPLDEYKPTVDPTSTYIKRTIGPIIFDPTTPGPSLFGADVKPGSLITLEVGLGDYGSDASAYLLEEIPPSGFVIRNIKPHIDIRYILQGSRPTTRQQIFHDPQSGIMEPYDHNAGVNAYGASIRWVHHSNHPENNRRRTPTPTGIYTYELFPVSYNNMPPVNTFAFGGGGIFFDGTNAKGIFPVQTTGDVSGTISGINRGLPSNAFDLYISGPSANSGSIGLYIRTTETFTSSFIGSAPRTPMVVDFQLTADGAANITSLPGIEFGPPLYTKGPLFLDGTCPLFTTGPAFREKTLYIRGIGRFNTSGSLPSGLQMIEQGHITVSGDPTLFTSGPNPMSGNLTFYTQAGGVGRIPLLEHGHLDRLAVISGFIKGPEFTTTSGDFTYPLDSTLFNFPSGGHSPDLYIKGPEFITTSGNFPYPGNASLFTVPSGGLSPDLFSQGFKSFSSTTTLFIGPIPAKEQWTLYLKTGNNISTKNGNLFIHGFSVPSGVSGLNQAFNRTTMYIASDNVTIPYTAGGTGSWSMFTKADLADPINRQSWAMYLKADTTVTGVCTLFTHAHGIGESPRGNPLNSSVGMIISVNPDDPNRIGFIPHDSDNDPWGLFVKVKPGFFNTIDMSISGAAPISIFASGSLFVQGLFEQKTAIATLYLLGISGLLNSGLGGLNLFVEAGTLVYNTSGNLYMHGY